MDKALTSAAPFRLEETWTYKAVVLADRISRRVSAVVEMVCDLNLSQWRVLAAIADQPGRTASQVVAVTPMDKGIVSRAVASLVAFGLIERRSSPRDGRLSHLYLTDEGALVFARIVSALDANGVSGRNAIAPAEQKRFLKSLGAMLAAYGKESD